MGGVPLGVMLKNALRLFLDHLCLTFFLKGNKQIRHDETSSHKSRKVVQTTRVSSAATTNRRCHPPYSKNQGMLNTSYQR